MGKLLRGIQFVHGMHCTGRGHFGWENFRIGETLVGETFGWDNFWIGKTLVGKTFGSENFRLGNLWTGNTLVIFILDEILAVSIIQSLHRAINSFNWFDQR